MTEPRQNARTAGVREGGTLRVTWVKSAIGYNQDQKDTVKSLGLRRSTTRWSCRTPPPCAA